MDALSQLRSRAAALPVKLANVCLAVLNNPAFATAVASAAHHPLPHRQPGGLALHTWEVAKAAEELCGDDAELADLAFVAAVYHDVGKMHEYEIVNGQTVKTDFARKTGHIVYGWAVGTPLLAAYVVELHNARLERRYPEVS